MFLEDKREFPKILSLRKLDRCARYPCRAPKAEGDPCYCQQHREEVYAEAWLLIESEPLPEGCK